MIIAFVLILLIQQRSQITEQENINQVVPTVIETPTVAPTIEPKPTNVATPEVTPIASPTAQITP